MKIVHCCLAAFYIDNYSYQENILPKMHKLQGHNVYILASTETYIDNLEIGYIKPKMYLTKDGISITRIPYINWVPRRLIRKLRIYSGIKCYLTDLKPDIIFFHDCQFLSILTFRNYAKRNKVKIYVDCHTDFINSGKNWISRNILHRLIYRFCAKSIEKYTSKFYGTLPVRVTFLKEVYGLNRSIIELLPFGTDDSLFQDKEKFEIRKNVRAQFNIAENEFVIITGGKIDRRKNIHLLVKAFIEIINQYKVSGVRLIVFGKPTIDLEGELNLSSDFPSIQYLKWVQANEIHMFLLASDLAFFPGTHSVLWEEAVGLGVPCVFKKWAGIQHIDLGGNCLFLEIGNSEEIKLILLRLITEKHLFEKMKKIALTVGSEKFTYSKIAQQALN